MKYNTYYKIADETVIVGYDNTRKVAMEIGNLYANCGSAISTPNGDKITAVGVMESKTGKIYFEMQI